MSRPRHVIALLCSDLHLRDKAPPARAAEPDWYAAQERPLAQLKEAQKQHAYTDDYPVPIIIAGDIFHQWNSCARLINWFIGLGIPEVYAIPGQHDLPFHSLDDIEQSAYWTLVQAKAITHLAQDCPHWLNAEPGFVMHAFPWGIPIEFPEKSENYNLRLAVVHHYLHRGDPATAYAGAPASAHVQEIGKKLNGFHVAVFGDNHIPFQTEVAGCKIINSGGMQLVNSDDRGKKPGYQLLWSDGTVDRVEFDTSQDIWTDESAVGTIKAESEIGGNVIEALTKLAAASVDYRQGVRDAIKTLMVRPGVERYLLESIEP